MRILLVELSSLGHHDFLVVKLVKAFGGADEGTDEGNCEADGGLKDVDSLLDV